tara:strand:+ start:5586 stop:5891 length:306 start_codon:yes stop_codon:yes gene_type:complete
MSKIKIMGQAGKAVSYMFLGINHTARFASNVARSVGNGFTNKGLFQLDLVAKGGQIIKVLNNQTSSQVTDILEQMDNFGIEQICINREEVFSNDNNRRNND